eukprot:TRINITY_DN12387_c0_g1_i2.p1 TRINITY_DN12387_c0_g1~~TRINITY_DN12387_c0_g1_i2.p1  ORF type:complete len:306 (+),score=19.25 TRINITY_DN12387_c0_g1_i2:56-973(+)
MRASDVALGLLSAILSALFNGSWAVLSKLECAQVNPLVFMMYASLGVFASSWLVIPIIAPMYHFNPSFSGSPDYEFTYYGMLAGLLFILAIAFTFIAIPLVGISVSQGVWGGTAIVASFLWGVVFFPQQNPIRSMPLTLVALILLIVGTLGIAFKEQLARRLYKTGYEELDESDSPTGIAQRARRYSGLFLLHDCGRPQWEYSNPNELQPHEVPGLGIYSLFRRGSRCRWTGSGPVGVPGRLPAQWGVASVEPTRRPGTWIHLRSSVEHRECTLRVGGAEHWLRCGVPGNAVCLVCRWPVGPLVP